MSTGGRPAAPARARKPRAKKNEAAQRAAAELLTSTTEQLSRFRELNPASGVEIVDVAGSPEVRVLRPWDDDSFSLTLTKNREAIIAALNAVRLPQRLSALWHSDTKDLEIIWSAYNLGPGQAEIAGRTFEFRYAGATHQCEFGTSSDRLMAIAKNIAPITRSNSDFRNLISFHNYTSMKPEDRSKFGLDQARSFWIRGVDWNEGKILELTSNLNFYLTYYDARSPMILHHEPPAKDLKPSQRTRYVAGCFPSEIDAAALDPTLLSFWVAADDHDPMMRFLLYFRIIEYAAAHFVESGVKSELKRLLLAPNLRTNLDASLAKIIGSTTPTKMDDTQRFKSVVRQCVDPALLWRDVAANRPFFSKETKFDGGFSVRALCSDKDEESTFGTRGVDYFSDAVRKIRNALSHGKDQETAGVITPTTKNLKLFQPWVHLLAIAAGEVVLYRDTA